MKKGEQLFYGRARRIELAKKATIVIVVVLVLVLGIYFFSRKIVQSTGPTSQYSDMISYLELNGYRCQAFEKDGGSCSNKKGDTEYLFVRPSDGFKYSIRNDNYNLVISHGEEIGDSIIFRTTSNALTNYKSLYYTCTTDNSVIGELKECVTQDGRVLDSDVYLGVIEKSIYELNNILKASNFNIDSIINDYKWEKK